MIRVEDLDGAALVRLEHGKVNVLDLELLRALAEAFAGLGDADAVVLTGAGRAFSAGVDLRRIVDGGPAYVAEFLPALEQAILALFDLPRPVVCAVNGHAIAGGCVLAQACDVRLMASGTIGVPELFVGVPFPTAALEVLRHALGSRLVHVVVTQGPVDPAEALRLGLVDEVVERDALLDRALARARALGSIARETFALAKEQLHREAHRRIEELRPLDDPRVLATWQSERTAAVVSGYLDRLAARSGTA
jgi:enoyl-CoA hydratase